LLNYVFAKEKISKSEVRLNILCIIEEHGLRDDIINPKRRSTKEMERYESAEEWLDDLLSELVKNGFLEDE
jgi:hypothetical protein